MLCVIGEHLCPDLDTLISGIETAEDVFQVNGFQKYIIPYSNKHCTNQLIDYATFFRMPYEVLANDKTSFLQQKDTFQFDYVLEFRQNENNQEEKLFDEENAQIKTFVYTIET